MFKIKDYYYKLPKEVRLFIIKALLLFSFWKVLYNGFLKGSRVVDIFFTSFTAKSTVWLMQIFSGLHQVFLIYGVYPIIHIDNRSILVIKDGCNALELYVLFIAFLICIPARAKKMFLYIISGLAMIFVLNIVRCGILAYMSFQNINYKFVDIAHHYIFTLVVYSAIFMIWVKYMGSTLSKNSDQIIEGDQKATL